MTIEKDYLPDRNLCSEWKLSSFCKYSTFFLLVIATLAICDWFQEIIYGGVLFHRLRQWYFLLDFLNFIEKIFCRIATIGSCSFLVLNFLEEYLNAKIAWKYHCANVPWELQKLFQYLSFLTSMESCLRCLDGWFCSASDTSTMLNFKHQEWTIYKQSAEAETT